MLYTVLFSGQVIWGALIPLLPAFSARFHLTSLQSGALLAASSVTTLAVSLPAGMLAHRFGPRHVTLAGIALMIASDVGQAAASNYLSLVAARAVFGAAFGIIWTAGVAWMSTLGGEDDSRPLALAVTASGLGSVAGPALGGGLAPVAGTAAPFLVGAAVTAVPLVGLLSTGAGGEREWGSRQESLTAAISRSSRQPQARAALLLVLLAGLMSSVANLVLPLELHRNGLSTEAIGLAFSIGAGVFILSSSLVARFADRTIAVGFAAVVCLVAAGAFVGPALATSTGLLLVCLLLRSPSAAAMYAIGYPLGVAGARVVRASAGSIATMLNLGYASAALAGPIAAGWLLQVAAPQAVFAIMVACNLAAAVWLGRARSSAPPLPAGA
jgi:MFS transporter, DHA1 family, solute carrier family 18 (vesicular amine transporter), member 1/2